MSGNASIALLPVFLLIVCLCSKGYAGISAATGQEGANNAFWGAFDESPCVKPGQGWVMVQDKIVPLDRANTHHCYPTRNSANPMLSTLLNTIACHRTCKSASSFTDNSSLSQHNDKIKVRLFHWHLSSDSSYTSSSTQLEHIQSDLTGHLRSNKLKPDILVFTGAMNSVYGNKNEEQWKSLCEAITTELGDPEQLLPLDKRCQNPITKENMNTSVSYTSTHFIRINEIVIISLLPIQLLHSDKGESGMGCGVYSRNGQLVQFSYTLFLAVHFNDVGLKMMITSSEDIGVNHLKSMVGRNSWRYCMNNVLKPLLENYISDMEPMIAVSHISSTSFNPKMMTRLIRGSSANWSGEKELETLVNSQAQYYAELDNVLSKAPRISRVMSRGAPDNKKGRFMRSPQRFYAFRKDSPSITSYLDYLYYLLSRFYGGVVSDYAPMFPSYTTFTIDPTLLQKLPEFYSSQLEKLSEFQSLQLEQPFLNPSELPCLQ
ncbi:hypothetical protein [Endozoicomonas euniceicola]|uniref:Uncharacterized protein n=1 Tax=Endozoicomonas euniceicola TaxID=1234143 RepID=A0ABY6H0A6_9GAMM|nr:hypothetical protein [Endozoicomonas euniceicola]UYM18345.1 hypothetical protein NX720_10695 [Endozoicomonas euniceicola]